MASVIRIFTRDELEELDAPYCCTDEKMVDRSRWAIHYEGILHVDGKSYEISWQYGATESQEDMDEWYDEDQIEGYLVEKRPITVEEWVRVSV